MKKIILMFATIIALVIASAVAARCGQFGFSLFLSVMCFVPLFVIIQRFDNI